MKFDKGINIKLNSGYNNDIIPSINNKERVNALSSTNGFNHGTS